MREYIDSTIFYTDSQSLLNRRSTKQEKLVFFCALSCATNFISLNYISWLSFHIRDDGTEQTYLVKKIIIHPKYAPKTQDNDIAILQLDKPAMLTRAVKLACLPKATDILEHGK